MPTRVPSKPTIFKLPNLLRDFRPELFDHYLRITREIYLAQVTETFELAPLWDELEKELATFAASSNLRS